MIQFLISAFTLSKSSVLPFPLSLLLLPLLLLLLSPSPFPSLLFSSCLRLPRSPSLPDSLSVCHTFTSIFTFHLPSRTRPACVQRLPLSGDVSDVNLRRDNQVKQRRHRYLVGRTRPFPPPPSLLLTAAAPRLPWPSPDYVDSVYLLLEACTGKLSTLVTSCVRNR